MNRLALCQMLFIILSPILLIAQKNHFYWPDGKPFITKENNVKSHLDSIGINTTHDFKFKNTIIFYYSLSKEPVFVLSDNKAEIPEALKSYNHKNYLASKDFEYDVKEMIENSALDTAYALSVIGKPSKREVGVVDYSTFWIYPNYNLRINFDFHKAVGYEIINYAKLEEHGISLSGFKVTGSDYSTGFEINLTNNKPKIIKYVWFTVTGVNPVGDVVGTKTVKAIGPVDNGNISTWSFDNVIYSNVLETLKISGLKIQYMDLSTKQIPFIDIKKLFID